MGLKKTDYKCTFCQRTFVRKTWYEKHECEKKRRFMESHNLVTIKAHRLFNHWQNRAGYTRRGSEKSMDEFCKSPFFGAFKRLAEFTSNEYVVSAFRYIDWLVENKVPETKWCNPRDLDDYREYLRTTEEPEKQAETTCKNIRVWCADNGVEMPKFFSTITPGQAMSMVRENKLSPWVLLGYQPCVDLLTSRFKQDMLFKLNEHINVPYWLEKTEADEEGLAKVNEVVAARMNAS